jgi:hypothetical protein
MGFTASYSFRQGGNPSARKKLSYHYDYVSPNTTYTFTAPRDGLYEFLLRGAGGNGGVDTPGNQAGGGGSGAYIRARRNLSRGQSVTILVGKASTADTTATFPNGEVLRSGRGGNGAASGGAGAAGVATAAPGDVAYNGSIGGNGNSSPDGAAGLGAGGGAGGTGINVTLFYGGGGGAPGEAEHPGCAGAGNGTHGIGPGSGAGANNVQMVGGAGTASIRTVD